MDIKKNLGDAIIKNTVFNFDENILYSRQTALDGQYVNTRILRSFALLALSASEAASNQEIEIIHII